MLNSFSVLGIEPTTDKSIIQKAYADLLKKYHPEEHPEEFLRIQKAYKNAMNYAKIVKKEEGFKGKEYTNERILEPKPEWKPEWKPEPRPERKPEPKPEPRIELKPEPRPESKPEPKPEPKSESKTEIISIEETRPVRVIRVNELKNHDLELKEVETNEILPESLPDYINDISQKIKYQPSNYNKINSYIEYISERIWDKKKENADKEIESLFNINEFCQIAVLPEFMNKLEEKVGYILNGNLLVVQVLRNNYMHLAQGSPANKKLTEHAEFWSGREKSIKEKITKEKRKKVHKILAVSCILSFLIFYFFNRNSYVFRDAPTTQQVSDILYERYGVEIPPEEISKIYVSRFSTPNDIGRAVSYAAVYKNGEFEIPFHCLYSLDMASPEELKSNLERAVFQEYYFSYLFYDFAMEHEDSEITDTGDYQMDQDCANCHYYSVYDKMNNDFYCELEIYNSDDRKKLFENSAKFIEVFFKEDIVRTTGREYTFKVYPSTDLIPYQKDDPYLEIVVNADNYKQVLEVLKEKEKDSVYDGEKIVDELIKRYK